MDWDEITATLQKSGIAVSRSHVPYTYHHDAIRETWNEASRSDVAQAFVEVYNMDAQEDLALLAGVIINCMESQSINVLKAMQNVEFRKLVHTAAEFNWYVHILKLKSTGKLGK